MLFYDTFFMIHCHCLASVWKLTALLLLGKKYRSFTTTKMLVIFSWPILCCMYWLYVSLQDVHHKCFAVCFGKTYFKMSIVSIFIFMTFQFYISSTALILLPIYLSTFSYLLRYIFVNNTLNTGDIPCEIPQIVQESWLPNIFALLAWNTHFCV